MHTPSLPVYLAVAAGGKGRRLLVPHLDEAQLLLTLAQRLEEAVDAVARKAEDRIHSPVEQSLNQQITSAFGHFKVPHARVGQAIQPDTTTMSGWKA